MSLVHAGMICSLSGFYAGFMNYPFE